MYAAFLSVLLLFGIGSFAGAGAESRMVFRVIHEATRWISPVNFWLISVRGAGSGRWSLFSLGLVLQVVLSGAYLIAADIVTSLKGRME